MAVTARTTSRCQRSEGALYSMTSMPWAQFAGVPGIVTVAALCVGEVACSGSTSETADAAVQCASESGPQDCVLCSDQKWHCGSGIVEPCPPDLDPDASCAGVLKELDGRTGCLTCNAAGMGELWLCGSVNGAFGGPWQTIPYPYAPRCTP